MARSTPLTIEVRDEEIVVRLGFDRLKEMTEGFEPFEHNVTVTDPAGWARAVAESLGLTDEDAGLKPLAQELFEAAIDEASSTGARWLEVKD